MMSVMLSAAGSLRWFRDALAPGVDVRRRWSTPAARGRRPAATGCCFLPYLSGERSPHPDPLARGAFVGLTLAHDRRHLTRAVLEGVAFGLRDGLELMVAAGMPRADPDPRLGRRHWPARCGARSWPTCCEAEIATVSTTEGAAYGAALLAAVGAGWFPSVEAAAEAVVVATPVAAPGPQVARYAELHASYRELYPALAPSFRRLAR